MDQEYWHSSAYPFELIRYLGRKRKSPPSLRKFRAIGCACLQRVVEWIVDDRSRQAIATAERLLDGFVDPKEVRQARRQANQAIGDIRNGWGSTFSAAHYYAAQGASILVYQPKLPSTVRRGGVQIALEAAHNVSLAIKQRPPKGLDVRAAQELEKKHQCILIRDITGDPFRPVTLDPMWQTATVRSLAEAIYTERAFDRLPILADALEEAGCTSAALLDHCRLPGEHVRGCWVVDLVLDKS